MAFDAGGNLIVADALKGLLSIAKDGRVTVLANAGAYAPLHFPNAVVVARCGKIYLTDSSPRFTPAEWGSTLEAATLDILKQSSTGRVTELGQRDCPKQRRRPLLRQRKRQVPCMENSQAPRRRPSMRPVSLR